MIRRWVVATSVLLFASLSLAQVDEYRPQTVLAKPMPAITEPPLADAARANVDDNELVLGVEVNGQARAYPINQLTGPRREIINDVLGGTAIAATW